MFRDKIIELHVLEYLIGGIKGRREGEYIFDTIMRCYINRLINVKFKIVSGTFGSFHLISLSNQTFKHLIFHT